VGLRWKRRIGTGAAPAIAAAVLLITAAVLPACAVACGSCGGKIIITPGNIDDYASDGSGTADDPFIITGLEGKAVAVNVENAVFLNCGFDGGICGIGLKLISCRYISIEGCNFSGLIGIYAFGSSDINITGNIFMPETYMGIKTAKTSGVGVWLNAFYCAYPVHPSSGCGDVSMDNGTAGNFYYFYRIKYPDARPLRNFTGRIRLLDGTVPENCMLYVYDTPLDSDGYPISHAYAEIPAGIIAARINLTVSSVPPEIGVYIGNDTNTSTVNLSISGGSGFEFRMDNATPDEAGDAVRRVWQMLPDGSVVISVVSGGDLNLTIRTAKDTSEPEITFTEMPGGPVSVSVNDSNPAELTVLGIPADMNGEYKPVNATFRPEPGYVYIAAASDAAGNVNTVLYVPPGGLPFFGSAGGIIIIIIIIIAIAVIAAAASCTAAASAVKPHRAKPKGGGSKK